MRPRVFFFHYNKPASKVADSPKLSVHYDGTCHIVDHIACSIPIHSHHRSKQPKCVMKGECTSFKIYRHGGFETAIIA